eukprot:132206-Rhodomonas_salina.1
MARLTTKPRLTRRAVLQIYAFLPSRRPRDQTPVPCAQFAHELALRFGVCDRTVRDIWARRAWRETTRPNWSPEELAADLESAPIDDSVLASVVPARQPRPGLSRESNAAKPWRLRPDNPADRQASSSPPSSLLDAHPAQLWNSSPSPSDSSDSLPPTAYAKQWPFDEPTTWVEDGLHVQLEESRSETSSTDPFFEDWIRAKEWARSVSRRHA